ncbi:MAG TPA: hypothetical protein VFL03_10590 [Candidatus Limnocylindrales bacterium]|jgi:hypothetical protein|nr:hypothetical protein [Candidatus Limnocylindrales bacterium]
MTTVTVRPAARFALAAAIVASVAGCGGTSASASAAPSIAAVSSPTPASAATSVAPLTPAPSPTAVPGGQSNPPGPGTSRMPTTQTEWGEIVDGLPDWFPFYPDAGVAEVPDEVVSGSFEVPVDVESLVGWYTERLTERGYAVDTGDPLEDGSRVMDVSSDIPECRFQLTARPADGSTIMSVLVASACVNGTG